MDKAGLFFYDKQGKELASSDLKPIPLYKGMKISIQGMNEDFRVVDWSYHHGNESRRAGLKVLVEKSPALEMQPER